MSFRVTHLNLEYNQTIRNKFGMTPILKKYTSWYGNNERAVTEFAYEIRNCISLVKRNKVDVGFHDENK